MDASVPLGEQPALPLLALAAAFTASALAGCCYAASGKKQAATEASAREAREEAQPLKSAEEGSESARAAADAEKQALPPAEAEKPEQPSVGPVLQFLIVAVFILFGAGQALAVAVARGESGTLDFDYSAAVTCSEALKLSVALGIVLGGERSSLQCPPPKGWLWETIDLSVVAGFFAFQNELNYLAIAYLGAVLFVLLGNSLKIVFTVFFMRVLLGKQFAALQWLAVALLVVSATVSQAPSIVGKETKGFSWSLAMGLILMLLLATSAGFAAVRNELIFKRVKEDRMPFMLQNAVLYVWGIALNLGSWAVWGQHGFLEGFTAPVWISVVCSSTMGLMVAMMLKYLDNVWRCFSGVGQVLFTVLASRLLPAKLHEGSFDIFYLASLVSLAIALVVYQGHANPRLPVLVFAASLASVCIGLTCMWLDSH